MIGREHDVSGMTAAELERTRRELSASMVLSRSGAISAEVAAAQLSAVEAELAERDRAARRIAGQRATGIRLCSCGFGSDSDIRFGTHLRNNRSHREQDQP